MPFLSLFSGVWGYVAAAAMAAFLAGYGVHKIDEGTIANIRLADQKAFTAAVQAAAASQKRQDDVALHAAVQEAAAQQKIVTQIQTVTKEVAVHVPDTKACIPVGLVRLLDTAAGAGEAASEPAAGQPDDACAAISWRAFAGELIDDYGTGRQNAEQLNALQSNIRDMVAAANQ